MGIFFSAPPKTTNYQNIQFQIQVQRDELDKRIKQYKLGVEKDTTMAKKYYANNQQEQARNVLKLRRIRQSHLKEMENQHRNIEELLLTLEQTKRTQDVAMVMKEGNDLLSKILKTIRIEEMEKLVEDRNANREQLRKIDDVLLQVTDDFGVDIEDEMRALEEEIEKEEEGIENDLSQLQPPPTHTVISKVQNSHQKKVIINLDNSNLMSINSNSNDFVNILNVLKEWSNMEHYHIIFDSDIDGDGYSNSTFINKAINKQNNYFISFDKEYNIFGGYLSSKINACNRFIGDKNVFVFSMLTNGVVDMKKFNIKKIRENNAFWLCYNNGFQGLYQFGHDIYVYGIGGATWCGYEDWVEYGEKKKPFANIEHPETFPVQRIIVLQMN
ncbi:TLDc domain-containing protein [Entamoeba marina]